MENTQNIKLELTNFVLDKTKTATYKAVPEVLGRFYSEARTFFKKDF